MGGGSLSLRRHRNPQRMVVLLTSPQTRPFVRSIVERFRAHTTVMSQNEVHSRTRLKTVGTV